MISQLTLENQITTELYVLSVISLIKTQLLNPLQDSFAAFILSLKPFLQLLQTWDELKMTSNSTENT